MTVLGAAQWRRLRQRHPAEWPGHGPRVATTGVAVLVAVVVAAVQLRPAWELRIQARHAYADLLQRYTVVQQAITQGPQPQDALQRWAAAVDAVHAHMPAPEQLTQVLQDLDYWAQQQGLQVQGLQPQPMRRREHVQHTPLQLQAHGSFHAMGQWLEALGQHMPWVSVEELQVRGTTSGEGLQLEALLLVHHAVERPDVARPVAAEVR